MAQQRAGLAHTQLTQLPTHLQVLDAPGARDLVVSGGSIEFSNVVFGYTPAHPVLHGVSFRVPGGKTLAVVGSTGSGKSTILRWGGPGGGGGCTNAGGTDAWCLACMVPGARCALPAPTPERTCTCA